MHEFLLAGLLLGFTLAQELLAAEICRPGIIFTLTYQSVLFTPTPA